MVTMYRSIRRARDRMGELQSYLRSALLADNMQDMGKHGSDAMALTDRQLIELKETQASGPSDTADETGEVKVERVYVEAAVRQLNFAWASGEKLGLATNVEEMRERLIDFKTHVDFADAYVRASLGLQEEG